MKRLPISSTDISSSFQQDLQLHSIQGINCEYPRKDLIEKSSSQPSIRNGFGSYHSNNNNNNHNTSSKATNISKPPQDNKSSSKLLQCLNRFNLQQKQQLQNINQNSTFIAENDNNNTKDLEEKNRNISSNSDRMNNSSIQKEQHPKIIELKQLEIPRIKLIQQMQQQQSQGVQELIMNGKSVSLRGHQKSIHEQKQTPKNIHDSNNSSNFKDPTFRTTLHLNYQQQQQQQQQQHLLDQKQPLYLNTLSNNNIHNNNSSTAANPDEITLPSHKPLSRPPFQHSTQQLSQQQQKFKTNLYQQLLPLPQDCIVNQELLLPQTSKSAQRITNTNNISNYHKIPQQLSALPKLPVSCSSATTSSSSASTSSLGLGFLKKQSIDQQSLDCTEKQPYHIPISISFQDYSSTLHTTISSNSHSIQSNCDKIHIEQNNNIRGSCKTMAQLAEEASQISQGIVNRVAGSGKNKPPMRQTNLDNENKFGLGKRRNSQKGDQHNMRKNNSISKKDVESRNIENVDNSNSNGIPADKGGQIKQNKKGSQQQQVIKMEESEAEKDRIKKEKELKAQIEREPLKSDAVELLKVDDEFFIENDIDGYQIGPNEAAEDEMNFSGTWTGYNIQSYMKFCNSEMVKQNKEKQDSKVEQTGIAQNEQCNEDNNTKEGNIQSDEKVDTNDNSLKDNQESTKSSISNNATKVDRKPRIVSTKSNTSSTPRNSSRQSLNREDRTFSQSRITNEGKIQKNGTESSSKSNLKDKPPIIKQQINRSQNSAESKKRK